MFKKDPRNAAAHPGSTGEYKSADGYFAAAASWETSRLTQLLSSERRAWRVTFLALGGMVLSWVAIVLMMPLKETVPYVIRVDRATGATDIVTSLNSKDVGFDEVMDKYWLGRYVRARQSYDWYTLQADYNEVGLLSDPVTARSYAAQFGGDGGLEKKYSDRVKVRAHLVSVIPNGSGTATVRFYTETGSADGSSPPAVTHWVATIGYSYKNPSSMKSDDRQVNPLGFQVNSYRVDSELAGAEKIGGAQ